MTSNSRDMASVGVRCRLKNAEVRAGVMLRLDVPGFHKRSFIIFSNKTTFTSVILKPNLNLTIGKYIFG